MEGSRGLRRRTALRWGALALLFLLLTVFLTWPLAPGLSRGIPLGTEAVATVPLFNLWTLAWNVESLGRLYEGYWQAPIFHPAPNAFALSEPQPISGLLASLLTALTGSVVASYNLLLLFFLAGNGLLATAGLRALGLGWLASLLGGLLVLVLPFLHQEMGVLQLLPLAGVFALTAAVVRFAREGGVKRGLLLGAALALAYLLCLQTAVFAALVLAPAALWLAWPRRTEGASWKGLLAGGGLFLLLSSPVWMAQAGARAEESMERSLETARQQSARPSHYLRSAWEPLLPLPGVEVAEKPSRRAFWPGGLRLALALFGLVLALTTGELRRFALAAALILTTALLLSFGPRLEVGGVSLISALRALPGFDQIRSYFRFALFVQLAVVALAALGLELFLRRAGRRLSPRAALAGTVVIGLLAVVEIRPVMGTIQELPSLGLELPWLSWVLEETEPDDVLAFVPFPEGRSSEAYLGTSQWMYWQMRHWRPMVNGYSGFFPSRFRRLKKRMETFPSADALAALDEAGVRYCIVHRAFVRPPAADRADAASAPARLKRVFQDPRHGLDIYELDRPGAKI